MIKILLLSTDHRIYRGDFFLAPSLREGTKSLQSLGFKVGAPVGTRPPYLVLLLEFPIQGETAGLDFKDPDWHPIAEVMIKKNEIKDIYIELMLGGYKPYTNSFDVFYFGSGEQMASKLAHLVMKGKKRGTAGWVKTYERTNTLLPKVGGISLVTDGFGIPLCFIKTIDVEFVAFKDVTEEMARLEGEGDLSLLDWKRGHKNFWETYDSQEINVPFTEEEIIFFETFKVIKILGNVDE